MNDPTSGELKNNLKVCFEQLKVFLNLIHDVSNKMSEQWQRIQQNFPRIRIHLMEEVNPNILFEGGNT